MYLCGRLYLSSRLQLLLCVIHRIHENHHHHKNHRHCHLQQQNSIISIMVCKYPQPYTGKCPTERTGGPGCTIKKLSSVVHILQRQRIHNGRETIYRRPISNENKHCLDKGIIHHKQTVSCKYTHQSHHTHNCLQAISARMSVTIHRQNRLKYNHRQKLYRRQPSNLHCTKPFILQYGGDKRHSRCRQQPIRPLKGTIL